ncbi:MAG: hypothetical protein ACYCQJ_14320 [Nitrososphaerales archaeon]
MTIVWYIFLAQTLSPSYYCMKEELTGNKPYSGVEPLFGTFPVFLIFLINSWTRWINTRIIYGPSLMVQHHVIP